MDAKNNAILILFIASKICKKKIKHLHCDSKLSFYSKALSTFITMKEVFMRLVLCCIVNEDRSFKCQVPKLIAAEVTEAYYHLINSNSSNMQIKRKKIRANIHELLTLIEYGVTSVIKILSHIPPFLEPLRETRCR